MWTPLLVGALFSMVTFVAFRLSSLRPLCLRFYDPLAALWNILAYIALMCYFQQIDSRNFLTGIGGGIAAFSLKNVSFAQSDGWQFSGGWFGRYICTDSFPEGTLLLPMRGMMQPGCSSNLVSGEAMASGCGLAFFQLILRLSTNSSRFVTFGILVSYTTLSILSQRVSNSQVFCLLLQFAAGASASVLCQRREASDKVLFAKRKAIKFASSLSRDFLHTLIPPDVLANLDRESLGAKVHEVTSCTVMFCMFDFAVCTEEDFDFINDLFTDLDEAVERSGMFKVRVTDSITKCSIGCHLSCASIWREIGECMPGHADAVGYRRSFLSSSLAPNPFFCSTSMCPAASATITSSHAPASPSLPRQRIRRGPTGVHILT